MASLPTEAPLSAFSWPFVATSWSATLSFANVGPWGPWACSDGLARGDDVVWSSATRLPGSRVAEPQAKAARHPKRTPHSDGFAWLRQAQ